MSHIIKYHEPTCAYADLVPGSCDCHWGKFWVDADAGPDDERQAVVKVSGDYRYPGVVDSIFRTTAGGVRLVVEATGDEYRGMLHIFTPAQFAPVDST